MKRAHSFKHQHCELELKKTTSLTTESHSKAYPQYMFGAKIRKYHNSFYSCKNDSILHMHVSLMMLLLCVNSNDVFTRSSQLGAEHNERLIFTGRLLHVVSGIFYFLEPAIKKQKSECQAIFNSPPALWYKTVLDTNIVS